MVKWTRPAKEDLRAIHDFIANDSKFYARKVVHEIREKTAVLDRLPEIGRKVPETHDELIREIQVYSYRVIYEIRGSDLFVLAVVHRRRDIRSETLLK